MFSCPNCGYKSEPAIDFCPVCGTRMVNEAAPAYAAPAAPAYGAPAAPAYGAPAAPAYDPAAPAYGAPAAPAYDPAAYGMPVAPAAPEGASKGKVIAGGIIGISGFSLAIFSIIFTLALLSEEVYAVPFGVAIGFGIFSIPLSIVGLVLCGGAIKQGATMGLAKAGKILGLIGVILSGVALVLGIISFSFDSYNNVYDAYDDLYDAYDDYYDYY